MQFFSLQWVSKCLWKMDCQLKLSSWPFLLSLLSVSFLDFWLFPCVAGCTWAHTCSRSGEFCVFLTYRPCEFKASFLCQFNPLMPKFLGETTGNINAVWIWACSVAAQSFCVVFKSLSSQYPSWVSRHYSCNMCCFLFGKALRNQ